MTNTSKRGHQLGFNLVELSISLVVIGIILSIVVNASGVLSGAKSIVSYSGFVQRWVDAAQDYQMRHGGAVPSKLPAAGATGPEPDGRVNSELDSPLCGVDLINVFLAESIPLPEGNGSGNGQQDQLTYADPEGQPRRMRVCFVSTNVRVPGKTVGAEVPVIKFALLIDGLDANMARQLDAYVDGNVSTFQGRFRRRDLANSATDPSVQSDWQNNIPPGKDIAALLILDN